MTPFEEYERMKLLLGLDETDAARLVAMAPIFAQEGRGITDDFYEVLGQNPETSKMIAGRVDALKATHGAWMASLFAGDYGQVWFERQLRIGEAHVRVGLSPHYVEATMDHIRRAGERVIHAHTADRAEAVARVHSLLRVLDLNLMVINQAYHDERLTLMSSLTGMKRSLIENLIRAGQKRRDP